MKIFTVLMIFQLIYMSSFISLPYKSKFASVFNNCKKNHLMMT